VVQFNTSRYITHNIVSTMVSCHVTMVGEVVNWVGLFVGYS